jgi:hypothetical protein
MLLVGIQSMAWSLGVGPKCFKGVLVGLARRATTLLCVSNNTAMFKSKDQNDDIPRSFTPIIQAYSNSVFRIEMVNPYDSTAIGFLVRSKGKSFVATNKWPMLYSNGDIKIFSASNAEIPWTAIHYCGDKNIALIELDEINSIKECLELPISPSPPANWKVITVQYRREPGSITPRQQYRSGQLRPFVFHRNGDTYQILSLVDPEWMAGAPVLNESGFVVAILSGVYTPDTADEFLLAVPGIELITFVNKRWLASQN